MGAPCVLIALAIGIWLMVERLDAITIQQGAIMAAIDEAAQANADKVVALEVKVDETIITLGELKALIGTSNTANAEAVLAAANTKLDDLLARLGAAETENDPTPDA